MSLVVFQKIDCQYKPAYIHLPEFETVRFKSIVPDGHTVYIQYCNDIDNKESTYYYTAFDSKAYWSTCSYSSLSPGIAIRRLFRQIKALDE